MKTSYKVLRIYQKNCELGINPRIIYRGNQGETDELAEILLEKLLVPYL